MNGETQNLKANGLIIYTITVCPCSVSVGGNKYQDPGGNV